MSRLLHGPDCFTVSTFWIYLDHFTVPTVSQSPPYEYTYTISWSQLFHSLNPWQCAEIFGSFLVSQGCMHSSPYNHYYTSRLVADDLATEGSRISATILLTQLAWSILVSAPDRSNTNGQKLNEYSNKKLVSSIVTGVGGVGGWGVGGDKFSNIFLSKCPQMHAIGPCC